jgi:maltose O-acetyltransferase
MIKKVIKFFFIKFFSLIPNAVKAEVFQNMENCATEKKYNEYRVKYNLSDTFKFNGEKIKFYGNGNLVIGDNTYIGSYSTIQVIENYSVIIGRNCSISHNVRFYTLSINPDQDLNVSYDKEKNGGDIVLGDGVWIGANVFIKPGVEIGENSVVGANSIVTRSIPGNAIYGGVPAKLIKMKNRSI